MEYALKFAQSTMWSGRQFFRDFFTHLHDHFIPHPRNNYHPHILRHRALALFSALLVSVKIFVLATAVFGPVIPAFSSAITEGNIIALTNQTRTDFNLKSLTQNSLLQKAAQAKAEDMLKKNYFSHNTPEGKTPWVFIEGAGYNYITAGENLAINFSEAEDVEDAWMNSPGHKANILNKNYEEIGVGIAQGDFKGNVAIIVVQMFGTSAEQKIALTNEPTKVQTKSVPAPQALKQGNVAAAQDQKAGQKLSISNPQIIIENGQMEISATLSENAVKVMATIGEKAVMLFPKSQNLWQAQIPLSEISNENKNLLLKAYDINGQTEVAQLAGLGTDVSSNYNVLGSGVSNKISFLGQVFDPAFFEQKFYLIFIACMLASLILAISIKRHVQHLSLIANSSFVIVLATLLWMGK